MLVRFFQPIVGTALQPATFYYALSGLYVIPQSSLIKCYAGTIWDWLGLIGLTGLFSSSLWRANLCIITQFWFLYLVFPVAAWVQSKLINKISVFNFFL